MMTALFATTVSTLYHKYDYTASIGVIYAKQLGRLSYIKIISMYA